jgi:hypothetical protein
MFDLYHKSSLVPTGDDGSYCLQEQREYVIVLQDLAQDEVLAVKAHPDVCTPLHPGVWRLNFKNFVGFFVILGRRIEVKSPKVSDAGAQFQAMLDEIVAVTGSLPFTFNSPTLLPLSLADSGSSVLYHQWIVLRAWWHGVGAPAMEESLQQILHDPHRQMVRCQRTVDPFLAAEISPSGLAALVANPSAWARIPAGSTLAETAIGRLSRQRSGQALFPTEVQVSRSVVSLDTSENRFVHHVLEMADRLNRYFGDRVAARSDCPNPHLKPDVDRIQGGLASALQHAVFDDVGPMSQIPTQSMVLMRREGYRQFFQGYLRLLAAAELPMEPDDSRMMIDARDIATLYEYWTYFVVVKLLIGLLGPPDQAVRIRPDDWQVALGWETRVAWAGRQPAVRCTYNRSFPAKHSKGSYSVPMRPDIVLAIGDRLIVFDAKFRVRFVDAGAGGDPSKLAKSDDIHKMHAYRDALAGVDGAYALYPGDYAYMFEVPGGRALEGVGAIPLRPGCALDLDRLGDILRSVVFGDAEFSHHVKEGWT